MMFGRALIQWIRSCADLTEIPVDRRVGAGKLSGYKGNRSFELKQSLLIELLYDLSALKLVQPVHLPVLQPGGQAGQPQQLRAPPPRTTQSGPQ